MTAVVVVFSGLASVPVSAVDAGGTGAETHDRELQIERLVEALRHDAVRFNASDAVSELIQIGAEARPALQRALGSADWQQRQMAAYVLCVMRPDRPSRTLLRVCVEALADDALPHGRLPPPDGRRTHNFVNTPMRR